MDNPKKIALLIDCDNISFKMVEPVIKELDDYGDIIIKRAYGNWRNDTLKNWLTKLTELSIKPIHQIDYTKGKNATDMAIVIDAMDLMHLKKADAFALVSSDSDFTPLVMKLQEEGYKVYVFGTDKAPISLKNACAVFTDVNALASKTEIKSKSKEKEEAPIDNKQIVLDAFASLSPDGEPVTFENFNREIKNRGVDFRHLGFKQLKVFLDSLDVFNITVNEKYQSFVQLKILRAVNKMNEKGFEVDETLKHQMIELYHVMSKENPDVLMSTFFNFMALRHNFNHKNYGFGTFKDFLESTKLFNFVWKNQQQYLQMH